MNDLCPDELHPDPQFYGGGLHAMPPGGWLDLHKDAERHPGTDFKRHTNLILFLDQWESAWGGELELWERERCEVSILPAQGRTIVFDCRDVVHGVPIPTNPFGAWRRSLAVFWYDPTPERRRAQFLPMPRRDDETKDDWRRERAGMT